MKKSSKASNERRKPVSITWNNLSLIKKIADSFGWTVNQLTNYVTELFIYSMMERLPNGVLKEGQHYWAVVDYASEYNVSHSKALKRATKIFWRLYIRNIFLRLEQRYPMKKEEDMEGSVARVSEIIISAVNRHIKDKGDGFELDNTSIINENSELEIATATIVVSPPDFTQKQTVPLEGASLIEESADVFKWSVNKLINYAMELILFAIIEEFPNKNYKEGDAFRNIRDYASKHNLSPGLALKYAVKIFARLYQEGILRTVYNIDLVKSRKRTIEGIIADFAARELELGLE